MMLIPWKHSHELARPADLFDRQVDRLFGDFFGGRLARSEAFVPRLDVTADENRIVVAAELPGMDQKDLEVSLDHGRLTISGEKKDERDEKDKSYHVVERSYGRFSRTVELGDAVDVKKAAATYKDGILTVTVPKSEAAKPRKIDIQSS